MATVEEPPVIEKLSITENMLVINTPIIEKSPVRVEEQPMVLENPLNEENELLKMDKPLPNVDESANIDESTNNEDEYTFKIDENLSPSTGKAFGVDTHSSFIEKFSPAIEKPISKIEKQIISPALQETDSALLESIVSQTPISLDAKLEETSKELSIVKTGTKIADSILQKFNSIKNEMQSKSPKRELETIEKETKEETKDFKFELSREEIKHITAESELPKEETEYVEIKEEEEKAVDIEKKAKLESSVDTKKKKRILSKAFIEETDSESSDSEQLIIARSDEDSQTNSLDLKLGVDLKESDSSNAFMLAQTTDDSQSQEERNFNFDNKDTEVNSKRELTPEPNKDEETESNTEVVKEEEPDLHLHSLLLCEEEIPRSPAPPTETVVPEEPKLKSEMPFASAPGSSCNNKGILHEQPVQKKIVSPIAIEVPLVERVENATIMDNTAPTTPESTISNLSPRGYVQFNNMLLASRLNLKKKYCDLIYR